MDETPFAFTWLVVQAGYDFVAKPVDRDSAVLLGKDTFEY